MLGKKYLKLTQYFKNVPRKAEITLRRTVFQLILSLHRSRKKKISKKTFFLTFDNQVNFGRAKFIGTPQFESASELAFGIKL